MSSTRGIFDKQIIVNGAMASTNTITTNGILTTQLDNIGLQFIWTGTPNGSFFIDGSNDNATWGPLSGGAAGTASGSAGDLEANVNQFPFKYIRARYVNSSSSGTLNVYMFGKGW